MLGCWPILLPELSEGKNPLAEFAVEVREHILIAHSLPDPVFGRAEGMHGATFLVDVTFFREKLSDKNIVVNIGLAHEVLKAVLAPLNYRNLDEKPELARQLTTTEFLCRYIFDQLVEVIADGMLGEDGKALSRLRVTLQESHVARASYEGPLAK
jgi:6-pyruvoyl-tetrahydropterin synthase